MTSSLYMSLESKDSLERKKLNSLFLTLVRLGIGTSKDVNIPNDVDWNVLKDLADKHGLSAVVLDGIEKLPEQERPPKVFLLEWIGETLQDYEYRYDMYCKAIADLAGFYNSHGYKMMVLKGYACSLDWPRPEHRPCGDIDIWQFGKQKESDALLESVEFSDKSVETDKIVESVKKMEVDRSHHHHTVFYWGDFMVENHYDFINVHHHKSNAEVEQVLKELAQDDSHFVEMESTTTDSATKVYLPSTNLHALFLLKHTMIHFAAEGISLRQLLDWGFFMKAHHQEIDWPWFTEKLEQFGMTTMFNIFNAICVEDLGFDAAVFHQVQFSPFMNDRVLKEILSPEYGVELPKSLLPRLAFKYRRWKGSTWKHELCYKESMRSAFWSGLWNHLLKPSSI